MSSKNNYDNSSVLAIGVDAAESTVVRQLIEQGQMPALGSLLAAGKWLDVQSPSPIGSGTVWPTFLTGEQPAVHGNYSEWKWLPETMSLRRYKGHHLTPFWKTLTSAARMYKARTCKVEPFALLSASDWEKKSSSWTRMTRGKPSIAPGSRSSARN